MRQVREILRLKHACGASDREIDRPLSVARSTIELTLERIAAADPRLPWPVTLTANVLDVMLYPAIAVSRAHDTSPSLIGAIPSRAAPSVTLMLLWADYRQREGKAIATAARASCIASGKPAVADDAPSSSRWRAEIRRLWRPDCDLIDRRTGEVRRGQIFGAVMSASNYPTPSRPDPEFAGLDRRPGECEVTWPQAAIARRLGPDPEPPLRGTM
jgi:hypothetical protein